MKKNSIKILLFVFTIFISISSFSQKNIFPGYVVSLKGDTLRGYIKYGNWEVNPLEISFWEKKDGEAVTYSAKDIRMFSVKNDEYVSASVKFDDASQKLETLSTDPDFNYRTDTLFLLILVKGEKSLFYYFDKNERKMFFIKTDSGYAWLEYRKYLKKHEDGLMEMVTVNGYILQLAEYLIECKKTNHDISKVDYRTGHMTRLFKDYYKCISKPPTYVRGNTNKPLEIGILAGMTITKVSFKSKFSEPVFETEYSTSNNFTLGMKIEAFIPRNFNRWSFNNELLFTNYQVNGHYEDYTNENKYSKSDASIGFLHFRMSNMLRYTHTIGKLSVFSNAGITNAMTIGKTNQVTTETKFYHTTRFTTSELFDDTHGWEFGLNIGFGARWKNISLEYRYEWGSSFIGYGNHSSATNRNYFLLGYTF